MISENNDFMCSCQNSNNFRSFKARKTIRISFNVKMCSPNYFLFMQIKLGYVWKVLHRDLFWWIWCIEVQGNSEIAKWNYILISQVPYCYLFSRALNFTKMEWAYYAGLKICDVNRNSQKLRKYLSVLILKQSRNWHNLF